MASNVRQKRGCWSQDNLEKAVTAILQKEMSDYTAEKQYGIPRRTLRRYVQARNKQKAKLGRKFALSEMQTAELSSRILRLSAIGYPITLKTLRLCVYKFCKKNNIKHQFSDIKQVASHKWARRFLKSNPTISVRKAQNLNPARAQKLNRHVVDDHFKKLKKVYDEYDIFKHPERLFNMDEKGCRLNLHKEPKVLAKKGARRVHIIGNEHGENVTIVACGSATGAVVPPLILFKGKRMKPEFADDLPAGSLCSMTPKGSMTSKTFVHWLQHLARHKPAGHCVLLFDGAKCHLDYDIVDEAEKHDIILYCLPSNTTHELQPLDKAVFRSFEYHWDEQVMLYWHNHQNRTVTKQRFGKIFAKAWDNSMTSTNLKAGFKATGTFPYEPAAIPDIAFAPSTATALPNPEVTLPLTLTSTPSSHRSQSPQPGPSGGRTPSPQPGPSGGRTPSPQPGPSGERTGYRADIEILPSEEKDVIEDTILEAKDNEDANTSSFSDLLPTPKKKNPQGTNKRRPAINSKGIVLKKSFFPQEPKCSTPVNQNKAKRSTPSSMTKGGKIKITPEIRTGKKGKTSTKESWYCFICQEEEVKDMRICNSCLKYVHEDCVGLSKSDKGPFICPSCDI